MGLKGRIQSLFFVDTRNIDLVRAQLANFNRQVPLLYFVVCMNAVLCAANLHGIVPFALSVIVPAGLVSVCVLRMLVWLRAHRVPISDAVAARRLKGVVLLGLLVGVMFLAWFAALFHYADDPVAKINVVFSVGLTALACTCCLLHLRAAARMLACVIAMPVAAFLMLSPEGHFQILGVNLFAVVATMIYVTTVTARDFERMVALGAENARLAHVDSLTGLPNRRHFFDRLDAALRRPQARRRPFAVGILDLDGFKSVNDVFGHATGDRLLIEVGRRLQRVAGTRLSIARLGGDEFGILVDDASDPRELLADGVRLCSEINRPITLRGGAVANVSASIGLAVYPLAGDDAELLYERADYALYHAKDKRRGQPVIFSEAHEGEIRQRGQLEQALRNADLAAELTLHFQPVMDVVRGVPLGFEALARWTSPTLGVVPPSDFIAVAEQSDLIHRITHTLLAQALSELRQWPTPIGLAFNLSMRDIASPDSIQRIVELVRDSRVDPARIEFEITESSLMADFAQAMQSVGALRALGARIALDDFGTGYSSLSHVHRLPLDKIKVDRSFISDLESRDAGRDILRTVIDLCQNLRIQCVVEGTETARQIEILRDLGCHAMQGYFFARPMPADEVAAFLERQTQREPAPAEGQPA